METNTADCAHFFQQQHLSRLLHKQQGTFYNHLDLLSQGMFFAKGLVILNDSEDAAVLSLGFRKWSAQSVTLGVEKDSEGQLFCTVASLLEEDPTHRPYWLWASSASAEDEQFKACAVKLLHPACVPANLRRFGCVLQPSSPIETLVKAALRSGSCELDVPTLKKCSVANNAPDPKPTGKLLKNGARSILKADRAAALLSKLFPEISHDSEEWSKMMNGILGTKISSMSEDCAAEILDGVKALDQDNQQKFAGLSDMAQKVEIEQKIQEELIKKGRGDSVAPNKARQNFTPKSLTLS